MYAASLIGADSVQHKSNYPHKRSKFGNELDFIFLFLFSIIIFWISNAYWSEFVHLFQCSYQNWNGIEILFIMPLMSNVFIESWIVANVGKIRYFELKMNANNKKKFIFISLKWEHTWPSQLIINMNILTSESWKGILKHIADGFSLTIMNFPDEFVDWDKTINWDRNRFWTLAFHSLFA